MHPKQATYRPPFSWWLGGVQQSFVRVQGVSGDVLCVGAADRSNAYIGVLEVSGMSYDLKSQREQERLIDLWQQILAGVSFPVQLLWRSLPLRLDPYLARFACPVHQPDTRERRVWETLAAAHIQHVQHLAARRTLVQRRIYLCTRVRAEEPTKAGLRGLFSLGAKRLPQALALEHARGELARRLDGLARHLELLDLTTHRLAGGTELGAFYQSCLVPLTAAQFPLEASVIEGADAFPQRRTFPRMAGADEPPAPASSPAPVPLLICPVCQATTPGWARFCGECGTPFSDERRTRFLLPPDGAAGEASTGSAPAPPDPTPAPHRLPWRRQPEATLARQTLFPHLADVLAPSVVEVASDQVRVGDEWQQVLVVRGLPRLVEAGWLRPLLDLDEPFDLSFHLRPQASTQMEGLLRRKRTQFQATKHLAVDKGYLVDPHIEIALQDIDTLMNKVASGAERLFELVWLVRVWGHTRTEVADRARKLQQVLQGMRLLSYPATYEQAAALRSCLPQVQPTLDGEGLLLPSEIIATAYPFVSSSLAHDEGVLVGVTPAQELVVLDPWARTAGVSNPSMVVFGPPGSGKSTLVKTLVTRLALRFHLREPGTAPGFQVFVIDPESEYGLLTAALGGQTVRLSPGSPDCINPFDLPLPRQDRVTGTASEENALAMQIAQVRLLLEILVTTRSTEGTPGTLTPEEDSLLDLALYDTYEAAGITRDPSTHSRTPPLMRDLVAVLHHPKWGEAGASLFKRLEQFTRGSESGLFSGPTTVNVQSPVVVFDTSACRSHLQQIIAQFLISTFVWSQAFGSRTPRALVVDEAATWLRYPGGKSALEQYTERARKHFLSVICITQEPDTFVGSKLIANSAIKWLHRPDPSDLDLIRSLFGLSEREAQRLLRLQQGEALLIVDDLRGSQRLIVKNEISDLELVLAQTDPSVLAAWATNPEYAHLRDLLRGLASGGLRNLASYLVEEEAS